MSQHLVDASGSVLAKQAKQAIYIRFAHKFVIISDVRNSKSCKEYITDQI